MGPVHQKVLVVKCAGIIHGKVRFADFVLDPNSQSQVEAIPLCVLRVFLTRLLCSSPDLCDHAATVRSAVNQ